MLKKPEYLLSIIIPTYNNAEFIAPALASLLVGLTAEAEIVIINDGSTDETDRLITEFIRMAPAEQITYIRQENQGVAAARNTGIALATGRYIAFVDGDDLVSKDYYSVLLPLLREEKYDLVEFKLTRNPNALFCQQNSTIVEIRKEESVVSESDYSALVPTFRASQWHLLNKIFHRRIIGEEKCEAHRRYEDLILVPFQYFKCRKILRVDAVLYYYRINPAGITENIQESDADNIFFAMRKMSDFVRERAALRTIATYMMINCFLEGRKIIRKKRGYYAYSDAMIEDIKAVLTSSDLSVINKKVLKKMQRPKLDTFVSWSNYRLLKMIKKSTVKKETRMPEKIQRILVCKLKFYGDVLLITPVIESLRARYPDARIDLLLYKDTKAILAADPNIHQFYLVEKHASLLQRVKNFMSLRSELKKNHYDIVINMSSQWPVALLLSSLHRKSVAFMRNKPRWDRLFTHVTPSEGTHVVEQNLSILKGLGFADAELKPQVKLHYRDSDYQSLLKQDATIDAKPYALIQPTSRQSFKCWDDDKFAEVIDHLQLRGLAVYLTCGPAEDEQQQVRAIAALCKTPPSLIFAGKTTFLQLAALIDHARLYIGVDSAPMHMAAALHKPQVCLFGATKPQQWRPWSDKATVIWAGDYHPMPERKELDRSKKYLTWIPSQAVIKAVDNMLSGDKEYI